MEEKNKLINEKIIEQAFRKVPNFLANLLSVYAGVEYELFKDNIKMKNDKDENLQKDSEYNFIVTIKSDIPFCIEMCETSSFDKNDEKYLLKSEVRYNIDIEKCRKKYYEENNRSKIVRCGALLSANNLSEVEEIIGDDLFEKGVREEFLSFLRECLKNENTKEKKVEERSKSSLENQEELGGDIKIKFFEKGIRTGCEETLNDIIKRLLVLKFDTDIIADITGSSPEEIENIKTNI